MFMEDIWYIIIWYYMNMRNLEGWTPRFSVNYRGFSTFSMSALFLTVWLPKLPKLTGIFSSPNIPKVKEKKPSPGMIFVVAAPMEPPMNQIVGDFTKSSPSRCEKTTKIFGQISVIIGGHRSFLGVTQPGGYTLVMTNRASHGIDGPNRNRWFTEL